MVAMRCRSIGLPRIAGPATKKIDVPLRHGGEAPASALERCLAARGGKGPGKDPQAYAPGVGPSFKLLGEAQASATDQTVLERSDVEAKTPEHHAGGDAMDVRTADLRLGGNLPRWLYQNGPAIETAGPRL